MGNKLSRRQGMFFLVFGIIFVLIAIYGSPNVRGSDQYWHVQNVNSIMKGTFLSNEFFANILFNKNFTGVLRPFIHNQPIMYLWAFFGFLVKSPFLGILICNILLALISSYLMYLVVDKLTNNKILSNSAYLLFLFSPLNFWQTINPLTEIFAMFLWSIVVYLLVCKSEKIDILSGLILSIATVAALSRENGLIILLVLIVYYGYKLFSLKNRRSMINNFVSTFIPPLLVFFVYKITFPDYLISSSSTIKGIISKYSYLTLNGWTEHNNIRFIQDQDWMIIFSNFAQKFIISIKIQFLSFGLSSILLTWYINILVFAAISISLFNYLIKKEKNQVIGLVVGLVSLISILMMGTIFQNQARYSLIFLPFLIPVLLYNMNHLNFLNKKLRQCAFIIFTAGILSTSMLFSQNSRASAINEKKIYDDFDSKLEQIIPKNEEVLFISKPNYNFLVSDAIYPRILYILNVNYELRDSDVLKTINTSKIRWIIVDNSAFYNLPNSLNQIEKHTISDYTIIQIQR